MENGRIVNTIETSNADDDQSKATMILFRLFRFSLESILLLLHLIRFSEIGDLSFFSTSAQEIEKICLPFFDYT